MWCNVQVFCKSLSLLSFQFHRTVETIFYAFAFRHQNIRKKKFQFISCNFSSLFFSSASDSCISPNVKDCSYTACSVVKTGKRNEYWKDGQMFIQLDQKVSKWFSRWLSNHKKKSWNKKKNHFHSIFLNFCLTSFFYRFFFNLCHILKSRFYSLYRYSSFRF